MTMTQHDLQIFAVWQLLCTGRRSAKVKHGHHVQLGCPSVLHNWHYAKRRSTQRVRQNICVCTSLIGHIHSGNHGHGQRRRRRRRLLLLPPPSCTGPGPAAAMYFRSLWMASGNFIIIIIDERSLSPYYSPACTNIPSYGFRCQPGSANSTEAKLRATTEHEQPVDVVWELGIHYMQSRRLAQLHIHSFGLAEAYEGDHLPNNKINWSNCNACLNHWRTEVNINEVTFV